MAEIIQYLEKNAQYGIYMVSSFKKRKHSEFSMGSLLLSTDSCLDYFFFS